MNMTELIGEEFKDWGYEEAHTIFLGAPTGAGKTFFILNKLLPYIREKGEKLKIFVPRITLLQKYEEDIQEYAIKHFISLFEIGEIVSVDTYQALEERMKKGKEENFANYVVFDECHYWLSDSIFNTNTIFSYSYAINRENSRIRIFISATGERIFQKIIIDNNLRDIAMRTVVKTTYTEFKKYTMQKEKKFFIHYYDERISKAAIITKNISKKWVVFVNSIEEGVKLKEELLKNDIYAIFINRKNKDEEASTFYDISAMEQFRGKVLITTAVVETGINFREDVGNIIIESNFAEQFIQMLGRKRLNEGEIVELYLPCRSERYFRNLLEGISKILEQYSEIISNTENKVLEMMLKEKIDFSIVKKFLYIQGNSFQINSLSIEEVIYQKVVLKKRIKELEKDSYAFIKEQLNWINMEESFCKKNMLRENLRENAISCFKEEVLKMYLEKKVMNKEELIKYLMDLIPLVIDIGKDYIIKENFSVKSFNKLCKDIIFPYHIVTSNKNNSRRTHYWLEEIISETLENQELEEDNGEID